MAAQQIQTTDRQRALAEVAAHQAALEKWTAEAQAARSELAQLQAGAGDAVLADESAAARVTREIQEARDRAHIADRTVGAVGPKLLEARRAVLLAEAVERDAEAEKLQKRLDKHNDETERLLQLLRDHEGEFISEHDVYMRYAGSDPAGRLRTSLKSHRLRAQAVVPRTSAALLRAVASGADPSMETPFVTSGGDLCAHQFDGSRPLAPSDFPASIWGPDALLPAPGYLRSADREGEADQRRRDEAEYADVLERIAELEPKVVEASDPQSLEALCLPRLRRRMSHLTWQRDNLGRALGIAAPPSDEPRRPVGPVDSDHATQRTLESA